MMLFGDHRPLPILDTAPGHFASRAHRSPVAIGRLFYVEKMAGRSIFDFLILCCSLAGRGYYLDNRKPTSPYIIFAIKYFLIGQHDDGRNR